MASTSNVTILENSNVNGLTISQNVGTNYSITPTGSTALGESLFINLGSYQQVYTGSANVSISRITVYNTSATGSINISASGVNIGNAINISPGQAASIPINGIVPVLYAQAVTQLATGSFFVIPN